MFRSLVTRTVLPLLLAAGVVAYFGLPYIDRLLTEWFRSDVELRARLLMSSMDESLPTLIAKGDQQGLRKYTAKIIADQRVLGILICLPHGGTVFKTELVPTAVNCESTADLSDGTERGPARAHGFGAGVGIRSEALGPAAVSGGDPVRPEFRRQPAEHRARLPDRVRRRIAGHPGAVPGAGGVAGGAALGQDTDRRHQRPALLRQRQVRSAVAADPAPGAQGAERDGGDASGWRSTTARTGRRRRCSRWCAISCIRRR